MYRSVRIKLPKVIFVLILFLGFIFPERISAQIVINEFVPKSSQEWVEFYNISDSPQDLSGYYFDDDNDFDSDSGTSDKTSLRGLLPARGLCYWNLSLFLNDGGDAPTLFRLDGSIVDSFPYTSTSLDTSYARIPDGGDWQSNQIPAKATDSCISLVVSTPTPTIASTPTPSPSPCPTSTKANYKINKSKDGSGSELTSVQIYVDGIYIHHLDDEILEFFNGHECYSGVECSLGVHTISLRKTGYTSWEDTQNFLSGMNMEVNPTLEVLETSSPTPTITPTVSPGIVLKKTSSPSAQMSATESGALDLPDILGLSNTLDSDGVQDESNDSQKIPVLPIIIIILGIGFIAVAIFSIIKSGKKDYTCESEKQSSETY